MTPGAPVSPLEAPESVYLPRRLQRADALDLTGTGAPEAAPTELPNPCVLRDADTGVPLVVVARHDTGMAGLRRAFRAYPMSTTKRSGPGFRNRSAVFGYVAARPHMKREGARESSTAAAAPAGPWVTYGGQWGPPGIRCRASQAWRAAGAVVTTWRRGEERQERDWHLIDPIGPLVERDTDSAPEGPADVTVRAVGTETEGAGGQWGHTAIGRGRAAGPLQVYRIAPYRDLAVGQVSDDEIRCGSSTGKDETSSRRQMETRLAMAVERGMVPEGIEWRIVGARRPWPQGTTEGEVRWRGRTATVEPTGKVGYALAPGIAFRIVRRAETLNRA